MLNNISMSSKRKQEKTQRDVKSNYGNYESGRESYIEEDTRLRRTLHNTASAIKSQIRTFIEFLERKKAFYAIR